MKIGIISDTHNQLARVTRALELFREHGAQMILHCGDIEDAIVVEQFQGWNVHFVYGNCDWDKQELQRSIKEIGATLHDNFGHLELEGKNLAFVHGHDIELLNDLVNSDEYDYLFHGHTHVACDRMKGKTRIINPGALHRVQVKTCLLLELPSGKTESLVVE